MIIGLSSTLTGLAAQLYGKIETVSIFALAVLRSPAVLRLTVISRSTILCGKNSVNRRAQNRRRPQYSCGSAVLRLRCAAYVKLTQ